MTNVLTGIFEITLGMSAVIAVCALLLLAFGKKLTAKSRYLIWSLIILRLAVPVSAQILPPVFNLPALPVGEITLSVTHDGGEADKKLPQSGAVTPETEKTNATDKVPVSTDAVPNTEKLPAGERERIIQYTR